MHNLRNLNSIKYFITRELQNVTLNYTLCTFKHHSQTQHEFEQTNQNKLTNIVMASAVLSLFNSSSIELSDEKESVKFLDCTICINSSCHKQGNKEKRSRANQRA